MKKPELKDIPNILMKRSKGYGMLIMRNYGSWSQEVNDNE